MKKAMFILSTVLFFGILTSCGSTLDGLTVKKNWIFTSTVISTSNGVAVPAPATTEEKDNLTEVEAEAARLVAEKAANDAISTNEAYQATIQAALANGITMTIKVTITKAVKP